MSDDSLDEIPDPPMHFDRLGQPISLRAWLELLDLTVNGKDYKRIATTHVGRWWISTVWMGLDHGFSGFLPGQPHIPMIFETMVFDRDSAVVEWEMRRYSTEEQARQGHEEMVQLVQTLENADPARTQVRLDDLP